MTKSRALHLIARQRDCQQEQYRPDLFVRSTRFGLSGLTQKDDYLGRQSLRKVFRLWPRQVASQSDGHPNFPVLIQKLFGHLKVFFRFRPDDQPQPPYPRHPFAVLSM